MNRSSCASGRANVPSYSIGFCVAMTRNGEGIWYVTPSIVACRSSMHSSSALWVLGVARLISSARTTWAMIGPGRNSNSVVFWLKIDRPVTSDGRRSGVNWMRRNVQPMLWESAFASIVLPTPGTSSMRMWPWHSSATSAIRTSTCLPTMTRSTLATARSAGAWTFFTMEWSPLFGPWGHRESGPFLARQYSCALRDGSVALEPEPLRHHLAADGCRAISAGSARLDEDRDRDLRRRVDLGRGEADEPGVGRLVAAELRRPGLPGRTGVADPIQRDVALPGEEAA